jgi:hypothetical protein
MLDSFIDGCPLSIGILAVAIIVAWFAGMFASNAENEQRNHPQSR